jgi:hypothetical protein
MKTIDLYLLLFMTVVGLVLLGPVAALFGIIIGQLQPLSSSSYGLFRTAALIGLVGNCAFMARESLRECAQ